MLTSVTYRYLKLSVLHILFSPVMRVDRARSTRITWLNTINMHGATTKIRYQTIGGAGCLCLLGRRATLDSEGERSSRMLLPLCQSIFSRYALVWNFTQHRAVIPYRRFGTAYRSHLKSSRSYWTSWPLKELTVAIRGTVADELPSVSSAETKCCRRVVNRCVTMPGNTEEGILIQSCSVYISIYT